LVVDVALVRAGVLIGQCCAVCDKANITTEAQSTQRSASVPLW
jgi:hypothetical protein